MPPRRLNFDAPGTPAGKRKSKSKTPGRSNKFSAKSIGENVGSANTKQVTAKVNTQMLGWTLYTQDMTFIERGTEISQRQRDVVNLRGFKIDMMFRTITQTTGTPLQSDIYFLNVAVIAPHERKPIADFPVEFFRSRDTSDSRDTNFATTLGSIDLHTLPINTDRWTVLKHQRHKMPTFQSQIPGWNKTIEMYVPLNRQLTYFGTGAGTCNTPVYLAYWVCRGFSTSQVDAATPFTDVQFRTTSFYRETPN